MKNNSAYTLIEMLMVIFISVSIIYIMSFNMHPLVNDVKKTEDMYIIINTFLDMQSRAIKNQKEIRIKLFNKKMICKNEVSTLCNREFNNEISTNFRDDTIKINEDGNISQAGTIKIDSIDSIIFHLGNGSYEIVK